MVGLCILLALGLSALGLVFGSSTILIIAGTLVAAAIPFPHTFTNDSRWGRFVFGGIGAFAIAAGLLVIFGPWLSAWISPEDIADLAVGAAITALLSTWFANFSALRR